MKSDFPQSFNQTRDEFQIVYKCDACPSLRHCHFKWQTQQKQFGNMLEVYDLATEIKYCDGQFPEFLQNFRARVQLFLRVVFS